MMQEHNYGVISSKWNMIVFLIIAQAAAVSARCFPDVPLQLYPDGGGSNWNLLFDMAFTCRVKVTGWRYYAASTDTMYLDIMRPQDTTTHEIVYTRAITPPSIGLHTDTAPPGEYFVAEAGDFLAVHYGHEDHHTLDYMTDNACCGLTSNDQLSRVKGANIHHSSLPIGHTTTFNIETGTAPAHRLVPVSPVYMYLDECFPAFSVEAYPQGSGGNWNTFLDLTFRCDVTLTGWHYYADRARRVYIDIQRPGTSTLQYTIVHTTLEDPPGSGLQTVEIPLAEQFPVKSGDIISVHYGSSGDGTIPYVVSTNLCCGITSDKLSRLSAPATYHSSLTVGQARTLSLTNHNRLPALQPVFTAPETCFPPMPLTDHLGGAGPYWNVFRDMAFSCDSTVAGWKYYAATTKTTYIDIVRPHENSQYTIVHTTRVTPMSAGVNEHHLASSDQFLAKAGDIISIHYDDSTGGNIPYMLESDLCCGILSTDQFSRVFRTGRYHADLPIGHTFTAEFTEKRLAPVTPLVAAEPPGCDVIKADTAVYGDDHGTETTQPSVEACLARCSRITDLFCRSADYIHADGTCFINIRSIYTPNPHSLTDHVGASYLMRCLLKNAEITSNGHRSVGGVDVLKDGDPTTCMTLTPSQLHNWRLSFDLDIGIATSTATLRVFVTGTENVQLAMHVIPLSSTLGSTSDTCSATDIGITICQLEGYDSDSSSVHYLCTCQPYCHALSLILLKNKTVNRQQIDICELTWLEVTAR